MANILHIKASTRSETQSYSARAAAAFLAAYKRAHPNDTVTTLDLATAAVPEFGPEATAGKYAIMHGQPHTASEAAAWRAVEAAIVEFKKADKYVFSCPMWNFGIPYRLKQYLDTVVQPGYTFSFSPDKGYQGLVLGKPALVILARGGAYAPGTPTAAYDLQRPYLETVLGFMGFRGLQTVVVEPTLHGGPAVADAKLKEACDACEKIAASF
jgi:FMN-dependent NADH-azoreductase